jgi:hypothetical protein
VAAHAVGDDVEPELVVAVVGVLVRLPVAPDVGAGK